MNATFVRARRDRRRAPWLVLGLIVFAVRLAASPQFVADAELVDRVIALIDRRLALMPEVAAIKFRQQAPVVDPARERGVLEQSVADAQALQLDPEAARAFFSVQIRMARAVQEQSFDRWRAGASPPQGVRDLVTELRPELDAIGRDLLRAVYLASPAFGDMPAPAMQSRLSPLLRYAGVTPDQLDELARALGGQRITAIPTWATLRRVGVLRVGTTGDYAPFSDDHGGTLQGLDIEVVRSLAKSWGISLMFVRTSWPTLMEDLRRKRFDLAASGVTITEDRRRQADFSVPYYFDGKTPIARRESAARYSSLEQIDQPGVRVVVNPGGTNERFVREHLKRARVLVHPDNRTIFAEIVAGRADVMITDAIEVRLQERRHPELKGTMSEPLTRAGKAILLPAGSELTPHVDAWLKPHIDRGHIREQLTRALEENARRRG